MEQTNGFFSEIGTIGKLQRPLFVLESRLSTFRDYYSSKIAESRLRYGIKIQLPPMVLLYSRLYRRRNNTCI